MDIITTILRNGLKGDFACLCDKVGSGKSLTVKGLISSNNCLNNKKNVLIHMEIIYRKFLIIP